MLNLIYFTNSFQLIGGGLDTFSEEWFSRDKIDKLAAARHNSLGDKLRTQEDESQRDVLDLFSDPEFDSFHPDHPNDDSIFKKPELSAKKHATRVSSKDIRIDESEHGLWDKDRIVRHRKVYVMAEPNDTPLVAPIKISIPVKAPKELDLPPPKPVFKYRKQRIYESKPEIQMVPVTKTIIRPVGVSSDQIIDENGKQVSSTFDAKNL